MHALFLTADFGGNVPPTLAVAEALAAGGSDAAIAGLPAGRTALPHVPFAAATAISPEGRKRGPRELGALRRLMIGKGTSAAVTSLIAERDADVVVVDCMAPAVMRGALASGVPVVVLFHTFGSYWMRSFDRGASGAFFRAFGLRPRTLWERAAARLFVTDPQLDPSHATPELVDYTWTGTTETGVEVNTVGTRPRVLVALSSSEWPGMLPVYRRIIAALALLPIDAIVTTGGVDLGGELTGARNVEVCGWVSHGELLPTTDLVIGHGGHSTTMNTLAHGIPLLILPINPTADQRLIGEVIQSAGLGRWMPKSARPEQVRQAVEELLADSAMRDRARATGRRLRSAPPGAQVAAALITEAASRRE